jgi:hypothetical protein
MRARQQLESRINKVLGVGPRYIAPEAGEGNLVMQQRWQTSGDDVTVERRK